ncbi:cytochrome P450 [Nocardia sp. NPDC060256]|uniref:cytochrome P450 n=1 Tax=unclassified Nocardia TaxID=2637762 RepID=UPI00366135E9
MLTDADPITGERLDDNAIRSQCLTMLVAGHEITAAALAFALHELAQRPDIANSDHTYTSRGGIGARACPERTTRSVKIESRPSANPLQLSSS